jgi:hypothetical protein
MVNVFAGSVQPFATPVTVIVPDTGEVPGFTAVNGAILPLPPAPSPIEVLLLVQLKLVPATVEPKYTGALCAPLHTDILLTCCTFGDGFTVMVKLPDGPLQPLATGTTVIVAVTAEEPALMAVKLPILPLPVAASPIDGLSLTQL